MTAEDGHGRGRADVWRWPVLLALYLASRLVALTALPMFLDERIHLRWAYWIAQGRRLRLPFISGRGLSVYMLAGVAPKAEDPLLAGRLLTVCVGVVTLIACHRLTLRATGDPRAAFVAALFYIACPFTLMYDRMVLTDSFLSAATAVTLVLALRMAQAADLRTGLALGGAMAAGILSKTTGLVLLAFPVLAVGLLGRARRQALRPLVAAYAASAVVVAYPLWLFFRKTDELAGAMGMRENETSFAGNAAANLRLAAEWLWAYWTPGLVVLAALGLGLAAVHRERRRAACFLALLAAFPTVAFVAVSEIWYPRYLLFTTIPALPLAACGFIGIVDFARRRARLRPAGAALFAAGVLTVVLVPALRFDLALWSDPSRAPFPALDRFQYVTGWPSGYGLRDSLAFLGRERERHPGGLLIVTPGPSTTASALRLLSTRDPNVEVRYLDPAAESPAALAHAGRAVFVVVSLIEGVRLPEAWSHDHAPVFASFKPDGTPTDQVYRACAPGPCR